MKLPHPAVPATGVHCWRARLAGLLSCVWWLGHSQQWSLRLPWALQGYQPPCQNSAAVQSSTGVPQFSPADRATNFLGCIKHFALKQWLAVPSVLRGQDAALLHSRHLGLAKKVGN